MRSIRKARVVGDVAYVPLTKGYEAVIDVADLHIVSGYNWTALVAPHAVYAYRAENSDEKRRNVYMHRAIMGEPDGMEVDHIDCIGLNNRRANLRLATRSENGRNRRRQKNSASGLKGVSWNAKDRVWVAFISADRKQRYLGQFSTQEEAHSAYVAASNIIHGPFGRPN